ncbi:MAG TPA: SDR family oxidoreductase [Ghiorsea sp.]|nr:SDR family oxidoreductase [Ghiorsea sp.]HIP06647.1 SDR family oxidoreductase [Mariprofundaceae bacterium]
MSKPIKTLLILGCGYVGSKLAATCLAQDIQVKATVRSQEAADKLKQQGIDVVINDNPSLLTAEWLIDCAAVLDSIPLNYDEHRKPFETQSLWVNALVEKIPSLKWAGYLSATSVYADSGGDWIDETSTNFSTSPRGVQRLKAEQTWLNAGAPAEVFRLAGIYGDERNIINKLKAGNYKTVAWQPAHYSNRIHADDIVAALMAAMLKPQTYRIINLSDDAPCSHQDYVCQLAEMIGAPEPIVLTPEQAEKEMSATYLDFFRDNKRISNQKLHQDLLPTLKYPSFKDGVASLR